MRKSGRDYLLSNPRGIKQWFVPRWRDSCFSHLLQLFSAIPPPGLSRFVPSYNSCPTRLSWLRIVIWALAALSLNRAEYLTQFERATHSLPRNAFLLWLSPFIYEINAAQTWKLDQKLSDPEMVNPPMHVSCSRNLGGPMQILASRPSNTKPGASPRPLQQRFRRRLIDSALYPFRQELWAWLLY